MEKPLIRRRVNGALIAVVAAALVAVGAGGAALLLPQPEPPGFAVPHDPESVAVVNQVFDGARTGQARLVTTPETALHTRAQGTVTATECEPGTPVESGAVALEVDGSPVVYLATRVPLWRDLAVGAQGDDVLALQEELARLGNAVVPDGRFRHSTQAAVREVLGEGARGPGALPLSRVVWLPAPHVTPSECHLRLGASVEPGAEVVTIAGGLTSLVVNNAPEGDDWVAVYQDLTAPVLPGGTVTDPAFLAAVASGPEFGFAQEQGTEQVEMRVRLANALNVAVVPPSSIAVAGEGRGCVWADGQAHPVRIVASSLGQTMVQVDGGGDGAHPVQNVTIRFPDDARCVP
ncbi:MAG: peptidoglycan-binding protein [Cellulomonadaceae bacterium]|jgi:peptidoglycan hydrolase-like protein with peptidoglycan-binding domain|nr:peptidoglycan-binding protein [Cellulomonadaceae bacterium]